MKLTDRQKELVEKIGVALEGKGQRPAAARIIGLLYVAGKPELSFEEISASLQFSKSATSMALQFLQQSEQLEYITHLGDRKRYFRLKLANWQESLMKQLQDLTKFNVLLREVLASRNQHTPEYHRQINELSSFLDFIAQKLPHLMEEWKKEKFLLPS